MADCSKVQRWISTIPVSDRDLPLIVCCNKYWTPNDILAACYTNSPDLPKLLNILEAHGFGGASPINISELAKKRLEQIFKNVHVLTASQYVYTPEELLNQIRQNTGLGRRLVEAETLRMIEQVSKYG